MIFGIAHCGRSQNSYSTVIVSSPVPIRLTARKLPENSAVLLRKNSLVVNEPLNVAGHRRCEFDHLLRRLQDRINLVACIRRRTGDAKLGSDVRADLHSSAPPIWTVRSLIIGFILGLCRQDAAKAVNDVTIIAVDNVPI